MPEEKEITVDSIKVTLSPWPKTGMQVLSLLIVAVFLAFVIVLLANQPALRHELLDYVQATRPHIWDTDKNEVPTKTKFYQMGFWTPSPDTNVDLVTLYKGDIPADKKWESNVTDERVAGFGAMLKKRFGDQVIGYRWSPTTGLGRRTSKRGYWWTLTVEPSITVPNFNEQYKQYWGPTDTVYIETLGDFRYTK